MKLADGADHMKRAIVFPGQGSQTVGMGRELADAFPEARAVFDEVDEALGEKLTSVMWDGPEETLTLTANAQPALMAVSMAVVRVLEAHGFVLADKASALAGHSLGEYSAHAAAGTFSLADTARLLRIRGNAMQAAVPAGEGAMAAILGLESAQVEAGCAEAVAETGQVCQIANDNGGGQIVISGARKAVETASSILTGKGAKRAIPLPVSAPFHSALMAPAADAMRNALSAVAVNAPSVPVYANVTVAQVTTPDAVVETLVSQVTGRVRWAETVAQLSADGIGEQVEAGAGKVLSGLARRIDRNMATVALSTPADIEAFLNASA